MERCRALLNELEDINALFLSDGRKPSGTIRVDLPERIARLSVIPALPDFFARYPEIKIRVGANDRMADLVGEGIDCAVRAGVLRDSTLVAKPLGAMVQVNVASPAYLAAHGTPSSLENLKEHWAVNYFSSQTGRDLPWEYVVDGR